MSYTYSKTKPLIEEKKQRKKLEALSEVLPPFDNDPLKESIKVKDERGMELEFHVGKKNGAPSGCAFVKETVGYGGKILVMVGVTKDGKVYGVRIIDHNETIGLGSKVADEPFLIQFRDRDLKSGKWEIKKTGGDFDAVSSATISSRAVIKGVKEALEVFEKFKGDIFKE